MESVQHGKPKGWMDIEQLLSDGNTIRIKPQGYSMYPLFVPGRDEAVISPLPHPPVRLKRGDVVLYRRQGSILVLHRIWKINRKGIFLVGDNQTEVEGPLPGSQMRGILTSFVWKGKEVSVHQPVYVMYSIVWLRLRPFRHKIAKIINLMKKSINYMV